MKEIKYILITSRLKSDIRSIIAYTKYRYLIIRIFALVRLFEFFPFITFRSYDKCDKYGDLYFDIFLIVSQKNKYQCTKCMLLRRK